MVDAVCSSSVLWVGGSRGFLGWLVQGFSARLLCVGKVGLCFCAFFCLVGLLAVFVAPLSPLVMFWLVRRWFVLLVTICLFVSYFCLFVLFASVFHIRDFGWW